MSTASAVAQFLSDIQPTSSQRLLINQRRNLVAGRLTASFGAGSSMPIQQVRVIGSADRDTIVRPLHDIDLLAAFAPSAYYDHQFDSRNFLYKVRNALNEGGAYLVGARGQAVRIQYQSGPVVDVAAVVPVEGGGYFLPSGDGSWLRTDPDRHRDWINERNRDLGYHLKPMARLL